MCFQKTENKFLNYQIQMKIPNALALASQYIDKKHGAAEPGEAENAAPRQRMRNSQTPPKTELRHSKKQDLRRVQNGTFGTP